MKSGRMWILAAVLSVASVPALGFTSGPAFAKATAGRLEAGSSDPAGQAKPKPAKAWTIVIEKATFGDAPAAVAIGDTIEWVNLDIFDHTTTSKTGGWDVIIPAGKKARVVMKKAGTFEYLCRFHPNMTGKVTVAK